MNLHFMFLTSSCRHSDRSVTAVRKDTSPAKAQLGQETFMNDEKKPLRSPAVQIAVSRTPVESPDRSLPRVFPKWLKVAKLWYQRESAR